jgi:hypothetical protein
VPAPPPPAAEAIIRQSLPATVVPCFVLVFLFYAAVAAYRCPERGLRGGGLDGEDDTSRLAVSKGSAALFACAESGGAGEADLHMDDRKSTTRDTDHSLTSAALGWVPKGERLGAADVCVRRNKEKALHHFLP